MSDIPKNKTLSPQLDSYTQTDVLTANRETILLMMYAGAIRFLKKAIEAVDKQDIKGTIKYIQKTHGVVSELRASLDFNTGRNIAIDLERLYDFVTQRLLQGQMKKSSQPLKEALQILTTLNEAWEQAISSLKQTPDEGSTK